MQVIIPVAILLLVFAITMYSKFRKEKKARIEMERNNFKMKAELALMETEQLKFQLLPHTLNNILMNLKLVAKKLNKGMDALSETLDYILYKGTDNHLVSIEDEYNFIRKYLALNDLFISEIDAITIVDNDLNKYSYFFKKPCIPHLITAHFIENAFKHGDINHPEFLKINLGLNDKSFTLKVINKIKSRQNVSEKGGIGLKNMKRRLDILANERYEIKFSCNETEYYSTLIIRFD
jgi:LytS/YehU family sensor histidine kinase